MILLKPRTLNQAPQIIREKKNGSNLIQTNCKAMELCSSKHPKYAKTMNDPGLLPDGGVFLPPDNYGLPPLDSKHKAVILYLYYMTAEVAVDLNADEDDKHAEEDKHALRYCSHFAISVFMEKIYGLKIHPNGIPSYYRRVRGNVERAGIPWGVYAVADIISRQVTDENTFDEITSFVTKVEEVSPKPYS